MKVSLKPRSGALRVVAGVAAVAFGFVCYVYLTLPDVRGLATENPSTTAFMRMRAAEAAEEGLEPRHVHRWVPYSRISPSLRRAVLVAEDSAFWDHEGIDTEELHRAIADGVAQRRWPRGASTITQQLAKNLYLSPSYDPLRKLRELIIARRLEVALSKARILEIYLNVIEWGDRIWGAEGAARAYFGTSAASLSRQQAALLAGAIINPRVYSPARPNRRLSNRQRLILARMGGSDRSAPARATQPVDEPPVDADILPLPRLPRMLEEEETGDDGDEMPVEHDDPEGETSPAAGPPPA